MEMRRRLPAFAVALAGLCPSLAMARPTAPAPAPELPSVRLGLRITEAGPDERWTLHVENTTSAPVRVTDDPRLLWLEVARPGQATPTVCRLPDDLLPKGPTEKTTKELAPNGAIEHQFDPRFYCFSPGKQETLVPSAQVTPHYGWPSKTKAVWKKGKRLEEKLPDVAPFVAEAVDSHTVGPAKSISGDNVVLDGR